MLLLNQWIVKNCLMENITGLIKIYLQILFQFTNGMFAFVFCFVGHFPLCYALLLVLHLSRYGWVAGPHHIQCTPRTYFSVSITDRIEILRWMELCVDTHYKPWKYSTVLMLSTVNVNGLLRGFAHQNPIRFAHSRKNTLEMETEKNPQLNQRKTVSNGFK